MNKWIDSFVLLRMRFWNFFVRNTRDILNRIVVKLDFIYLKACLNRSIYNRRQYYRRVKWSNERQKGFDEYWLANYGAKISSKWHRFYEGLTGVYCVDYMSSHVFVSELKLKFNDDQYSKVCGAKTMLPFFLNNAELGDCVPKHYAYKIRGYFYDGGRNVVTCEELAEYVSNVGACVFKSSEGKQGSSVCMLDLRNGFDAGTGQSVLELFRSTRGDFVLQERVSEHRALSHLSPNSLNTIRITTYVCEGKVYHAPIAIRFGVGESLVDNFHAGGLGVGVKDDGTLLKTAWSLDSNHRGIPHTINPNNGEPFEGYKIPYMDRVIEFVSKNHGRIPGMGMISWDVVLTEEGVPLVIEVNVCDQNIRFAQFLHCRPFFGNNTPKMLKLVKK